MKVLLLSLTFITLNLAQNASSAPPVRVYTSPDGSGLTLGDHASFTLPKSGKVSEVDQSVLKKFSLEILNKNGVEIAYVYINQYKGLSSGQRIQDIGAEKKIGTSMDELLIEESNIRKKYMETISGMLAEKNGYKNDFKITGAVWSTIRGHRARIATGFLKTPKGEKLWMSSAVLQSNDTVYSIMLLPLDFEDQKPEGDKWIQSLFKSIQEK